MKNEKLILKQFTYCGDNPSPLYCFPFAQGDYVYATDTRIILRVKKDLLEKDYDTQSAPDCNAVFDSLYGQLAPVRLLTVEAVRKAVKAIPMVQCDCPDCDGDGEVDYEFESSEGIYYHTHTCPVCNGSGKSKENERDPKFAFIIDEYPMPWKHACKILEAAQYLDKDNAKIYLTRIGKKEYKCFYFQIDKGIDGISMCSYVTDDLIKNHSTELDLQTY